MGRGVPAAVPLLSPLSVTLELASGDVLSRSSLPSVSCALSVEAEAAASRTACSLSCSTWAIAACMARPASWRCWLSSLPRARAAAQDELAGTPAPAALAAWCAECQLAATSPAT